MIDFADWVKMANLLYGAGVPGETRPGPVVSFLTGVGLMRTASCQADTAGGYFQRAQTPKLKVFLYKCTVDLSVLYCNNQ